MTYIITPILGMQLADPLTIQAFETTVVNSNFLALENGIGADRTRLTALEAKSAIRSGTTGFADFIVADLVALAALSALAGDVARVTSMGACVFRCTGTTNWVQDGVARFSSTGARDTEYAKAGGVYLVQGAQVQIATRSYLDQYYTSGSGFVSTSGWFPIAGALPLVTVQRNAALNFPTSESTLVWDSVTQSDATGVITYSAGSFSVSQAGWYDYYAQIEAVAGTTFVNLSAQVSGGSYVKRVSASQSSAAPVALVLVGRVKLSAGQALVFLFQAGSAVATNPFDGPYSAGNASLRYIGPA